MEYVRPCQFKFDRQLLGSDYAPTAAAATTTSTKTAPLFALLSFPFQLAFIFIELCRTHRQRGSIFVSCTLFGCCAPASYDTLDFLFVDMTISTIDRLFLLSHLLAGHYFSDAFFVGVCFARHLGCQSPAFCFAFIRSALRFACATYSAKGPF